MKKGRLSKDFFPMRIDALENLKSPVEVQDSVRNSLNSREYVNQGDAMFTSECFGSCCMGIMMLLLFESSCLFERHLCRHDRTMLDGCDSWINTISIFLQVQLHTPLASKFVKCTALSLHYLGALLKGVGISKHFPSLQIYRNALST